MALATLPAATEQDSGKPLFPADCATAFFLVTALFLLWGIANNLNDVLIRQFMKSFELQRLQAGLVQSAFYIGYFSFSVPAAMLMQRRDYKFGLVTGLLLYGTGTFLFWPAAYVGSYYLFLLALFVIASGLAFLETGANPLVAQLGDPESAVRRLNFSQAFNPIGAISGVLIGTLFIFSGVELKSAEVAKLKLSGTYNAYLHQETMRVVPPYLILGLLVLLWAFLIARTPFPAIAGARSVNDEGPRGSYRALLRYPHFLLAVLAQFCYVVAQVGTWSYFIQYVQDYTHQPERIAGYFLTGSLAGFGVGRFASSALMKRVHAGTLMGIFAAINVGLVAIGICCPGWVGLWAILLTSFFMSLMFPTIFALGIRGLGPNTKSGASLIVMAIIGGAVFTPLIAFVNQVTRSMAMAMIVPLVCYLAVGCYAFWGSKLKPRVASVWEAALGRRLPLFGHRNWIVVVDSAYPAQSNTGIETIATGTGHIEVLEKTLKAIAECEHIRAKVLIDAELKLLTEEDAPGVTAYRHGLNQLLGDLNPGELDHDQIISKLDESGRSFRILIFKSTLTIPYTSVFLELDCGYWNADAERRLRST
jgi:FHS family L-fucose permease-like MFS transporter